MNQGGYVTLVGFVAQDPKQRLTKDGTRVTDLRVGATTRVQDRVTNEWRDADTSYYDVTCWRRLGDHVRASMHKGEPVFVKGAWGDGAMPPLHITPADYDDFFAIRPGQPFAT